MKNLKYSESINWRTGAFQKRWVREELEQVFIETTSQDVTLATSFGSEMQCAQACSKADCGAFYVQVRQHSSCLWPFKLSGLQKDFQHMALFFKEDGLTCSLVPEDDSEGFKNVDNLDSADFNYFYKKD